MTIDYKKIGKQIKCFRVHKGYTQEKLAEMCDLSTVHLSYIETGKRKFSLKTLDSLSNTLDFSIQLSDSNKAENLSFDNILKNSAIKKQQFLLSLVRHINGEFEYYNFDK